MIILLHNGLLIALFESKKRSWLRDLPVASKHGHVSLYGLSYALRGNARSRNGQCEGMHLPPRDLI